ncbi:MAG: hypothetical protein L3K15_05495 [Thermoplasmata archaeon]|nr:hypothetical protein [Thermoplasmata archaeon]
MDGRIAVVLLTLALPAVLLGAVVLKFAANPLAILVLITTMVGGSLYLLSYAESF